MPRPHLRSLLLTAWQVVDNFVAGKSEGVSVFFIIIWLTGDTFNIIGCLLAQAVRASYPPSTLRFASHASLEEAQVSSHAAPPAAESSALSEPSALRATF